MPKLPTLKEARAAGSELAISNEAHIIGEDDTNYVYLHEVPLLESPSTVTISGYTEITTGSPADNQFKVTYSGRLAGAIEFNAADAGLSIQVTYKGRGSSVFAAHMNRVRSKLQGIQAVADAATMTVDLSKELVAYLGPLTANRAIEFSNLEEGLCVLVLVAQDSTGSRVPTWDSDCDFGTDGAPTLTTTANKYDALGFVVRNSKLIFSGIKKGFAV